MAQALTPPTLKFGFCSDYDVLFLAIFEVAIMLLRTVKNLHVKSNLSHFFRQHVLLLAALYVLTFGASLFIRSNLGASAISVSPLVWSEAGNASVSLFGWQIPALSVGGYTIIMNSFFVLLQIIILRRRYQLFQLFQLIVGTIFSFFLDVNLAITEPLAAGSGAAGFAWGLFLAFAGGTIMGVGVACEVRCKSVMMPGEGLQVAIAQVSGKEFSKVKIVVDTSLVCIALMCCIAFFGTWRWDIIGIGTLVSMVYIGIVVRLLSPHLAWFDNILEGKTEHEADVVSVADSEVAAPLVITISRQYGSGGLEIGQKVAKRLDMDLYDRAIFENAAQEANIAPQEAAAREQNISTAKLLESIILGNDIPQGTILSTDDKLFVAQSRFIRNVSSQSPCVVIGRCADYVLKGRQHLLRVFILSGKDFAARRIEKKEGLSEREAINKINEVNTARANHYFKYTNRRWGAAGNYDIVLNTSTIDIDEAVNIICQLATSITIKAMQ